MYADEALIERFVVVALKAMREPDGVLAALLDALPAPAYVTDATGAVTHFNEACIPFAGRTPIVGQDRWCVTWRLFTMDGAPLPHDECPMALAVQQGKPQRGVTAIAARPDGLHKTFKPFPTPLLGDGGEVLGAVNVFLDLTIEMEILELERHARNCRRIAGTLADESSAAALEALADEYEASVRMLNNPN